MTNTAPQLFSRIWTITALILILFLAGCGKSEIPDTSAPPGSTDTPLPVPTRLPPTSTPPPLPNGRIIFYSERDGNPEIYVMNSDGSDSKRLTDIPAEDITPAFSPDGRQIVFSSNRDGNFEIYIMDADGSNQRRLTNSPANDIQPAWSPDGTKILYTPYAKSDWSDGEIFVINVDGSNPTQLTNDPADDTRPLWSSDGSKIYFSSKRDGNFEIYVMNVDGSNQQRLTNTNVNELFPCPSPDGKKIAYAVVDFSTFKAQIHVMNADGSGDVILTDQGTVNEDPVWTEDGQHIIFQSNRDGNYEVYIMKADGGDQRRLTNSRAWDGWPGWGSAMADSAPSAGLTFEALHGNPPTLDGVLSPGEWDNALRQEFTDGGGLFLMQSAGYFYLGLHENFDGLTVTSVCLEHENEISILHSSGSLGTAIFKRGDAGWQLIQPFKWDLYGVTSNISSAEQKRNAFLENNGWLANLGSMTETEEIEYQIAIPDKPFRIAVAYLLPPNFNKVAWWPADLTDNCRKVELLQANIAEDLNTPLALQFAPETWATITIP